MFENPVLQKRSKTRNDEQRSIATVGSPPSSGPSHLLVTLAPFSQRRRLHFPLATPISLAPQTPNPDSDSLVLVTSRFPAPAVSTGKEVAMADDEQAEKKEEVPEVMCSRPFLTAHPVRSDSVGFWRR